MNKLFLFISCLYNGIIASSVELTKKSDAFNSRLVFPFAEPCDLTSNVCDINCCDDKDCSEDDKMVFNCPHEIKRKEEGFQLGCSNSSTSEYDQYGLPVACLYTHNSPYLGHRYPEVKLQEIILKYNGFSSRQFELEKRPDVSYTYGSSVQTMDGFLTLPTELQGVCTKKDVEYLVDTEWTCPRRITQDCTSLGLLEAVDINNLNITCHDRKIIVPNITVLCLSDAIQFLSSSRSLGDSSVNEMPEVSSCNSTKVHISESFCHNALLKVDYSFIWEASKILNFNIIFYLGKVPKAMKHPLTKETLSNQLYVNQHYKIRFHHAESRRPESVVRGYTVGKTVLFS